MGSGNNGRWIDIVRCGVLQLFGVHACIGSDDVGVGAEIRGSANDHPHVPTVPDKQTDVSYQPPPIPEDAPPRQIGQISDGTSMMYVQTCFWVASYVKLRAERGDFTEDQLIEQFGVNVRRCMNPDWKANG